MGVNGYGERPLGSVSAALAIESRCTAIIVKREVEDQGTLSRGDGASVHGASMHGGSSSVHGSVHGGSVQASASVRG